MLIVLERAKSSILQNGNFREFFLWRGEFCVFKTGIPAVALLRTRTRPIPAGTVTVDPRTSSERLFRRSYSAHMLSRVDHVYSSHLVDWQRFSRLSTWSQSIIAQRLTPGSGTVSISSLTSKLPKHLRPLFTLWLWRLRRFYNLCYDHDYLRVIVFVYLFTDPINLSIYVVVVVCCGLLC